MLKRDYEGQICSIARALQLVDSLGIASNVLTDRLNRLVDQGIVERVRYSERPERFEYRLTKKGRELGLVLLSLMQWGDRYASEQPPRIARRRSDRSPVSVRVVAKDGSVVPANDLELVPGPGLKPPPPSKRPSPASRPRPRMS